MAFNIAPGTTTNFDATQIDGNRAPINTSNRWEIWRDGSPGGGGILVDYSTTTYAGSNGWQLVKNSDGTFSLTDPAGALQGGGNMRYIGLVSAAMNNGG